MRIYVADDEPTTVKLISASLKKAGHDVTSFSDGAQAWEAYEAEPVPMVVTDWVMPRMTGIELTSKIRRAHAPEYTNVIVVTSLSLAENTAQAFTAGADDMLSKAFDHATLVQRVTAAERSQLAQADRALRQSIEIIQGSLGPSHDALLQSLAALTDVSRRQRSYVRCRAFIRRQIAIAEASYGAADWRTKKLRDELLELAQYEEQL